MDWKEAHVCQKTPPLLIQATFTSPQDTYPHHEFCPSGPLGWCRYCAEKLNVLPLYKYRLATHVATALLQDYQRLSDPQRLGCHQGKKIKSAAVSLHLPLWLILWTEQNTSLIAAETAVNWQSASTMLELSMHIEHLVYHLS